VLNGSLERHCVESRTTRNIRAQRRIVLRWNVTCQPNDTTKNHHERAQARLDQRDLFLSIVTRSHRTAAEVEKLSKRLLLDL
jgi:hypothetical protein